MSARKYTAALFENVDFKAQAAEIAKEEEAKKRKKREKDQQRQLRRSASTSNGNSLSGLFSRIFLRSPSLSTSAAAAAGEEAAKFLPQNEGGPTAQSASVSHGVSGSSGVSYPRVLLFGDSLTQYSFGPEGGWAASLADKLQRRADVVVRGFSGYNTRWCRIILDQIFAGESPSRLACVVILQGTNDASLPELFPKTHVPLEEYESNLIAIVDDLTKKFGVEREKIILITPPPVNRDMLEAAEVEAVKATSVEHNSVYESSSDKGDLSHSDEPKPTPLEPQPVAYCNETTSRYAAACRRAGRHCGVTVLDLFSAMLGLEAGGDEDCMAHQDENGRLEKINEQKEVEREDEEQGLNYSDDNNGACEERGETEVIEMKAGAAGSKIDNEQEKKQSLTSLEAHKPDWHLFFCDGIHFSRAGSDFFFSRLWPLVDQRVEKLPFKYPHWRCVDEVQPSTSLTLENMDVWDGDFKLD